ncbi:GspE/PulE family protein [Myxococcota bacterium]|nr:GspE/PulE family protein [Myxococcota bacterium]
MADDGQVVRLVDQILKKAVAERASDIHFEPKGDRLRLRFRVDGVLVEQPALPPDFIPSVTSRLKVMASMDIAEKRVPQDGGLSYEATGQRINIRASTFPTRDGEKVVLRLLAGTTAMTNLESLGIGPHELPRIRELAGRSSGLVLVTGPTGSGKSSTLYSLLKTIDPNRVNVTTLEDPIEVRLPHITQGQTNPKAGFTFARGLRAILRQDPDVIMVGEMRDIETAQIAFQASLTGHLVFSTLHTSSTVETITRLLDMGLEPYIVASSLTAVLAQRLVRKLCRSCAEPWTPDDDLRHQLGFPLPPLNGPLYRPVGCAECSQTGYKGRTGIFELMVVDDAMRDLIKNRSTTVAMKALLAALKLPTLRRDGVAKAIAGITAIDDVLRVT